MAAAIKSEWFRSRIAKVVGERWRRLRCREELLTGVSSFPKLDEMPVRLAEVDPALYGPGDRQARSAVQIDGFDDPAPAGGGSEEVEPFAPIRLSEPFEKLRDWALRWAEKKGHAPRLFMANLGRPSDFIAPATYARNLFASAGFEAIGGEGVGDEEALLAALGGVEAEAAVICGTPEDCRARTGAVMSVIREAGIEFIYLAGQPDILNAEDGEALSGAFYGGVDVVTELETLQNQLEGDQ